MALLSAGCNVVGDAPLMFPPEADAIWYLVVRDEALDAEVLWTGVHDDIKAETSRSDFVDCVYARANRTGPAAPASAEHDEFEPSIGNVAMQEGEVTANNVLVRDGITYSIADHRDDRGITSVDVRAEGPQDTSVTTVMLALDYEDAHGPGGSSRYWSGGGANVVVGTVPEDPCLVGGEAVRERLQTTATISVGHDQQRPELIDYRVLAVVWDGRPEEPILVGGAFWWLDDEGIGGDGVHPPNEGGGEIAGQVPPDGEEPRPEPDWVDEAFAPTELLRIEPGTYRLEVWANPSELAPSVDPSLPGEGAERNCTMEVEVTAGTHLTINLSDIPTNGGECPHETQAQSGVTQSQSGI